MKANSIIPCYPKRSMRAPFSNRRGTAIGTTLMIAALAMVVAFVLAGTSFSHLNVNARMSNGQKAEMVADSVIAKALADVIDSGGLLGQPSEPGYSAWITVTIDEAQGRLTFDPATAGSLGYSVNRHEQSSAPGFQGRVVPQNCLHLVGLGVCNGVERRVESLVFLPPVPFALGSSGPIHSQGNLVVGSLSGPSQVLSANNNAALLPGSLRSNATTNNAISLGAQTLVTGNVQSAGGAVLDPASSVLGSVQTRVSPIALPLPDLTAMDPGTGAGVTLQAGTIPAPQLYGLNRADANLVVAGDLMMNDALLYVDGDLQIQGNVQGRGIIVSRGDVDIQDGAALDGQNQAVLLANGDVALRGTGAFGSAFQGLVYTEGDFSAQQISVVGALIGNKTTGSGPGASSGSQIFLDDARMVGISAYGSLQLPPPASGTGPRRFQARAGSIPIFTIDASYANGQINNSNAPYSIMPGANWQSANSNFQPILVNGFAAAQAEAVRIGQWYDANVLHLYSHWNPPPQPDHFEQIARAMLAPDPDINNPVNPPGSGWGGIQGGWTTTNPPPGTSFDISEFFSLEDRTRVVLRKEL